MNNIKKIDITIGCSAIEAVNKKVLAILAGLGFTWRLGQEIYAYEWLFYEYPYLNVYNESEQMVVAQAGFLIDGSKCFSAKHFIENYGNFFLEQNEEKINYTEFEL